jgi:SET domain
LSLRWKRHGAFAKRDLPKGTIITGTPLVHFPNRDVLGMFDPKDSPVGPLIRDVEKGPYSYQILINYCFGHPESTILLCPYGAGVNYINANRTKANVKVQWAQDGNTNHNSSWLDTKPEDMEWVHKTMLAMDYVALRDIKKGEELFLDYGNSWEQAWEAHVKAWEAVTEREEYISSTQYNAIHSSAPVRTLEELRDNPYPQNLQINCHPALIKSLFHEMDYENRYKDPLDFIEQVGWLPENKGFECDILEHDTTTDTYKVTLEWTEDGQTHEKVRDNVPRKAIMFVDSPYTTDIHLPSAFRHPIDIPDEMLPEAWRNMECKMGQRCA